MDVFLIKMLDQYLPENWQISWYYQLIHGMNFQEKDLLMLRQLIWVASGHFHEFLDYVHEGNCKCQIPDGSQILFPSYGRFQWGKLSFVTGADISV